MQQFRNALHITRLVLVWFALSVGVAIASPVLNPMDVVCTGTGMIKLVVHGDDGSAAPAKTMDCPLCVANTAPPPEVNTMLAQPSPLAHAVQPIAAAHIAAVTAPPLPSRGPPALFL